ncbi:hypothetical protein BU17DRAFT_65073 [Hysterangium stoloniferum]|nr:hypothetical protein BU17DRAFT_65073 [Hysterangium stoloniferum]
MHFSLLALLACIAVLVQSAPSDKEVAAKSMADIMSLYDRAAVESPARNTTGIRFSGTDYNPVTIPIPPGVTLSCNATSFAHFDQRVIIKWDGVQIDTFQGSGENVIMRLPSGSDVLISQPDGQAHNITLVFQFDDRGGSGFRNAVVNQSPSKSVSGTQTEITITSEDSQDNDNDDTVIRIVLVSSPTSSLPPPTIPGTPVPVPTPQPLPGIPGLPPPWNSNRSAQMGTRTGIPFAQTGNDPE